MDGFFGIGFGELVMVAIIALIVLGPERLPAAFREVAKFVRQVRNLSNEFTSQFGEEFKALEDLDPRRMLKEAIDSIDEEENAKAATPKKTTSTTKTTPAAKTTPAKTTAAKTTSAKSTPAKTTAAKTTPATTKTESTTAESTAATVKPAKTTAGETASPQSTDDSDGSSTTDDSSKTEQVPAVESIADQEPSGSTQEATASPAAAFNGEESSPVDAPTDDGSTTDRPTDAVTPSKPDQPQADTLVQANENRIAPPSMDQEQAEVEKEKPETAESVVDSVVHSVNGSQHRTSSTE